MAHLGVVGVFLLWLPGAAETGFPAAPESGVFSCEGGACGRAMDRFPVAPRRFITMAFLSGSFPSGRVTPRIDPVRQEHPCYEYTAVRMCIVGGLLSLLFLFCIRVCG